MLKNRFLPLNLQFFAEGGESGDQAPTNEPGEQEQTNETGTAPEKAEEKIFRQEDVNNIVAREEIGRAHV